MPQQSQQNTFHLLFEKLFHSIVSTSILEIKNVICARSLIVLYRKWFDRMHSRSLWLSKSIQLFNSNESVICMCQNWQLFILWTLGLYHWMSQKNNFYEFLDILWIFRLWKKYFKIVVVRDATSFTWGVKILSKRILRESWFM